MNEVVIVGCGYVGRRVARRERAAGRRVTGLVRGAESAAALAAIGVAALRADLDRPGAAAGRALAGVRLYWFAPPPPGGAVDTRLRDFLGAIPADGLPERVVLISTTGVYGDCGGAWVDESRPPAPQAERARRRLDAEQALAEWSVATGVPAVVLRVPGFYGPGKLPEARLRRGEPVLREARSPWSNRVHVDDLVRACVAAMERGRPGAVYNVSDGHPTTMTDYFNRVADVLGLPRPPQIDPAEAGGRLSAGMRSYLAESKRLDNRRMREELGVEPDYPDLAAGLAACVKAGQAKSRKQA
jgi:nucleoside-diphosphate-sugar epimerase